MSSFTSFNNNTSLGTIPIETYADKKQTPLRNHVKIQSNHGYIKRNKFVIKRYIRGPKVLSKA